MMPPSVSPRIFIEDALLGWNVVVRPEWLGIELGFDDWLDELDFARAYARGLSMGMNCPVVDLSTATPTVVPLPRWGDARWREKRRLTLAEIMDGGPWAGRWS